MNKDEFATCTPLCFAHRFSAYNYNAPARLLHFDSIEFLLNTISSQHSPYFITANVSVALAVIERTTTGRAWSTPPKNSRTPVCWQIQSVSDVTVNIEECRSSDERATLYPVVYTVTPRGSRKQLDADTARIWLDQNTDA